MKDSLIVLSGGLDSTTMLYEYQYRIGMALSFHYGSNHNDRELEFAKLHCERLGIPHMVIRLPFIKQFFKSSLLEGADAIPEGNYDDENMKSTVVPFRNGIMLSIAAGIAENNKMQYVMLAGLNKKSIKSFSRLPLSPCYKPSPKGLRALARDLIPMRSRETFDLPEPIADSIPLRTHA